jgi:hypothetical protein
MSHSAPRWVLCSSWRDPRRLRATTVVVIVVVLGLLVTACASGHGGSAPSGSGRTSHIAAAAPVATSTRTFAPFDASGAPSMPVGAHRSGSCFTTSTAVGGTGVYRCFAGNQILDPCFAPAGARTPKALTCYTAPWSAAVQLTLTAAVPRTVEPLTIDRPWALELAGGVRCIATTGTTAMLEGVALGYRCPDGAAGLRDESGPIRHAVYQATDGAVRDLAVRVVWRAAAA